MLKNITGNVVSISTKGLNDIFKQGLMNFYISLIFNIFSDIPVIGFSILFPFSFKLYL